MSYDEDSLYCLPHRFGAGVFVCWGGCVPAPTELQDERFYANLRSKAGAKRRTTNNGQRRAALTRWNARRQAQEATIQRILDTPDAELDALLDSFETYGE